MNRVDRLFGILTLLQSKKYVPAEKIADKFNISVRTVYRDVKALCEQGIPVSFEANKGYFVVQGYFLPPVSFTSDEANALLLMEAVASGFADRSTLAHYSTALSKVKAVLKGPQKDKLEHLNNNIRLQVPSMFRNDFEYLSTLQNAISSYCILELGYTNNKGEVSTRKIEAIGLVFYAFGWHVIAWCHLRGEYRDFKVSRITHIRSLEQPFVKNDHMELNEYMKMLPVGY
ncbi:MAG: YafY family transcriptional regulator [Sphingobacteriales bacterium]|nr:MAG: YafY family transcriptional regulator [Sphingobacteriales bacterium]